MPFECIFMLFASHLSAFHLAFCTKIACVLHQNDLRLAPKCTAFSTKTHCVQQQNALHFAANSTLSGANCNFMQRGFILPVFTTSPIQCLNKPSRESIFCGKVGDWCTERALRMLKILLKTRQKQFYRVHAHGRLRGKRLVYDRPRGMSCNLSN